MNMDAHKTDCNPFELKGITKTNPSLSLSVRNKIKAEEKEAGHAVRKVWAGLSKQGILYLYARFGLIKQDAPIVTVGYYIPSIHKFIYH